MIRTQKEIAQLPKFSRNYCHSIYKVEIPIYVDNLQGLGVTKIHSDIRLRGFLNRLPMEMFFKLCGKSDIQLDEPKVQEIVHSIKAGKGVACPQVFIEIDGYMKHTSGRCRVVGFECLETAMALYSLGVKTLDFQFVLLGYTIRNIPNISSFFNWLSSNMECLDGTLTGMPIQKTLG